MSGSTSPTPSRREQLEAGLRRVRDRIATACSEAGRDPDEVTLIVVTKFFGASDVAGLAGLGVGDVAENRHQEAVRKAEECRDLGLRWHFVGGLQSNKAAAVAAYADVVHSVDRPKLLRGLAQGAAERGIRLDVCLQVSLDPPGADNRAGAVPEAVSALAEQVASHAELRLRGVMAVAPLGEDPAPAFDRLAEVHAALQREHPDATWLSAGMSDDLEAAVERGATHVRVGSAVLGSRPQVE